MQVRTYKINYMQVITFWFHLTVFGLNPLTLICNKKTKQGLTVCLHFKNCELGYEYTTLNTLPCKSQ
jgi:hypothetical protein